MEQRNVFDLTLNIQYPDTWLIRTQDVMSNMTALRFYNSDRVLQAVIVFHKSGIRAPVRVAPDDFVYDLLVNGHLVSIGDETNIASGDVISFSNNQTAKGVVRITVL